MINFYLFHGHLFNLKHTKIFQIFLKIYFIIIKKIIQKSLIIIKLHVT
jgi:hypothetical protein